MNPFLFVWFRLSPARQRALSCWIGSLLLLLQRSPLVKFLMDSRDLLPSSVGEVMKWSVVSFSGLGAYQTVAGASTVTQVLPTANSTSVAGLTGVNLSFAFKYGGSDTATKFNIAGTLPPGMAYSGVISSNTSTISGKPTAAGTYNITIQAADSSHSSALYPFSFTITNPPAPTISVPPSGGNYVPGDFVSMAVTHANGQTFTWKKGGTTLTTAETILFGKTSPRKYFVPSTTVDIGTGWRTGAAFTDTAWTSVSGGVGYDTNTTLDYNPQIATGGNVLTQMNGTGVTSLYLRMPFNVSSVSKALSYLKLRVQYDDGFVAFLNGTQIATKNAPALASLAFNSAASTTSTDSIAYTEIDVTASLSLLKKGDNLLAVHALNSTSSSDFLFNCELAGGIDATNSARLVLTSASPADAGSYTVVVGNSTSSVTSAAAVVNVSGVAPTVGTQPVSTTINSGATATLSVTATGDAPLSYQWFQGAAGVTTSPVGGATAASFTTPVLTSTTSYWVRVTNGTGSADSNAVTVTVRDPFASWQSGQFTPTEAANAAVSGPAADPDGDGLPNLLEFALGRAPKNRDGGAPLRPAPEAPVGGGAQQLVLRVPHVASLGNVTVRFQTATSPTSTVWTDVVNGVGGAALTDASGQFELRLPLSASSLFVRMVVNQP